MSFKIKYQDFPKLEFFLFNLVFPCSCNILISFIDNDEVYYYKTIEIDNKLILITT